MHPDGDEVRLHLRNPVGELDHLEVFLVDLKVVKANPERVGNQPAEAAQRHGGEGHRRGHALDGLDARELEAVALGGQLALREVDKHQQHHREQREQRFEEAAVVHVSPCPVPSPVRAA